MRLKTFVRAVTKDVTIDLDTGQIVSEDFSKITLPRVQVNNSVKEIKLPVIEEGEVIFKNQKKAVVKLKKSFISPKIVPVMRVGSTQSPFIPTSDIKKDEFTINFTNNFSGTVGWIAIEQ